MSLKIDLQIKQDEFKLDFNQHIPLDAVTAIFGSSGCGKSSLLKAIAGIDQYPGSIHCSSTVWQESSTQKNSAQVKACDRGIGFAMQDALLFPHMTVLENICFAEHDKGKFRFNEVVNALEIRELLEKSVVNLSGGQKQRVSLARALLAAKQLLLLDEPLSALDNKAQAEILSFLRVKLKEYQLPAIYVSHSLDEISQIADNMIYLDQGRVVADGDINALLLRADLPFAHRGDAEVIIKASFGKYDETDCISELVFSGGNFLVARDLRETNTAIRLRIYAKDVSVCLQAPDNSSILNIFPAEIIRMNRESGTQVSLEMLVGESPILARVSLRSANKLSLEEGKQVFVQIKSVALLL